MKKEYIVIAISSLLSSCSPEKSLTVFMDFEEGKAVAAKTHSCMFVIFDWFGSPMRYIDEMLNDGDIKTALEGYVVIRLMVDERTKINDSTTIGRVNTAVQLKLTGKNYQPMFCVLNANGELIGEPLGYSKKNVLMKFIESQVGMR